MEGIYISNLNAADKINAAKSMDDAASVAASQRLQDAKDLIGNSAPVLMTLWTDPKSCPDCTFNYPGLMVVKDSQRLSSVRIKEDVTGGAVMPVLKFSEDDLKKIQEFKPEALLISGIDGYDKDGKNVIKSPLVVKIVDWDSASGMPKVQALNGRKISPDDPVCLMPFIPSGKLCVMLKEIPEMQDSLSLANAFILDVDCTAIRPDAKRGDIFCYASIDNELSKYFVKLYSYQEKINALKRQPNKLIPVPDITSDIRCRAYFASDINLDALMELDTNGIYILLIDDVKSKDEALVNEVASNDESSSSEDIKQADEKILYKKGTFLYVRMDDNKPKFTKMPFDIFFQ